MFNWKIIGGFALFAALISLISGVLSGNPFGIILIRVFISSVLLGAVGIGVEVVTKKYLPELAGKRETLSQNGQAVDVVIDEDIEVLKENPHMEAQAQSEQEPLKPLEEAMEPAASASPEYEADLEEVSESDFEESESGKEDILTTESDQDSRSSPDVDSLPDMDEFDSSSFSSTSLPSSPAQAQVEGVIDEQDPATLAKAVRTFLNKDQEG